MYKIKEPNWLMPPIQHLESHCPEIDNSALDSHQKVALHKLWKKLRRLLYTHNDLSEKRGEALEFLDFLKTVLEKLNGAGNGTGAVHAGTEMWQAKGAGADSDPAGARQSGMIDAQARQKAIEQLSPAVRKAWLSFQAALLMAERKHMEDWEAYKLLKEKGIPEDGQGELTDYQLPAKDTWFRYLRKARRALGEQKYTPRRGRSHGGSIVAQDQIEQTYNDEE